MAKAPNIQDLVKEFQNVGAAEASARGDIDAAQGTMNEANAQQVDAIRREADLTGQVQTAVDQLVLEKTKKNQRSAAEFGTNQNAQSYVLGKLAEQQISNANEVIASGREIAKQASVGFTDDPLQWIVNQFELPTKVYTHNVKVAEGDVIAETITRLQNATEASARINAAISETTSTDIMHLNALRLNATAERAVAQARQEAAKTNLTVASVRLATTQQGFQNALALNRAQIDLQQLQIAQENLSMNRELRQERLDELRKRHENDALLQEDLDRATAVLGMRRITPESFKTMSGPMKDTLQFAMADPSMVQGRIGFDPVSAVERANAVNAPLTPEKQRIKSQILDMMSTAQQWRPDWQALKPEQKHLEYTKAVTEEVNKQLKNIPNQGSMFSAPPLKSLGQIPAVAESEFWKQHIAPLAKNEMMPTSAQQIFDTAVSVVSSGKMDLAQVSGEVARIYKAAVADNWHNRDYGTFSIKIPEQYRNSYNTRIQMQSLFGRDQNIDMANETAVQNLILRQLNATRMMNQGPSSFDRPTPPIL